MRSLPNRTAHPLLLAHGRLTEDGGDWMVVQPWRYSGSQELGLLAATSGDRPWIVDRFFWNRTIDGSNWVNATIGDFDGDGLATLYGLNQATSRTATVQIHRGGALAPQQLLPTWTLAAPENTHHIHCPGDVNADGYEDRLVAQEEASGTFVRSGRVQLHLGGPTGPDPIPAWQIECDIDDRRPALRTSRGDINGDGIAVLIVQSRSGFQRYSPSGWIDVNHAGVWVYYSGPGGPGALPDTELIAPSQEPSWHPLGPMGDLDGDGDDEIGAHLSDPYPWASDIFRGSPTGIERRPFFRVPGGGASPVGDLNADGYDDIAVSSSQTSAPTGIPYEVIIMHGSPTLDGDRDGEGWIDVSDCADLDAARHPDAAEVCNDDSFPLATGRQVVPDTPVRITGHAVAPNGTGALSTVVTAKVR